jgi:hypothetical protein
VFEQYLKEKKQYFNNFRLNNWIERSKSGMRMNMTCLKMIIVKIEMEIIDGFENRSMNDMEENLFKNDMKEIRWNELKILLMQMKSFNESIEKETKLRECIDFTIFLFFV